MAPKIRLKNTLLSKSNNINLKDRHGNHFCGKCHYWIHLDCPILKTKQNQETHCGLDYVTINETQSKETFSPQHICELQCDLLPQSFPTSQQFYW